MDMKRILQAFDNLSSKPVEGASDMKHFISAVQVLNKPLDECSGYIPKNEKEAKDPRWTTALSVDVQPGAIEKNLKALSLAEGKKSFKDYLQEAEQGIANKSLNEFAPSNGESGRWFTDDQMSAIVGDGWLQDLDISGDISKQEIIDKAQEWLLDNGYRVQVLNVKVNDDDCDWFIEGSFHNTHSAKKDVEEGLKNPKDNPCWKGYKPVGTKKKNGKTVPNCVPKE